MASMPESPPYALDSLFTIQRVEVVQSLEIDKLKATLQWLVDTVAQAPGPADVATLTQQVQALQAKDKVAEQQAERLRSLAEQQSKLDEGLEEATANAHKAQASLEELQALPKQVDQLKAEVAGLQSKLAGSRQAQEQLQKQVQDATSAGSNRRQSRDQPAAGNVSSEAPAALTAAVGADNVSEQLLNGLQQEMDDLKARQNELAAVQRDLARSNGQLQDEQARLRQGWTDRQVETDTALGAQAGRSAELGAEVATLRAAIEAVGQGKGFELPPSPPVAAPVDLGPLERRIGAKADAEEMTVLAKRLRDAEQALQTLQNDMKLTARSSSNSGSRKSTRDAIPSMPPLDLQGLASKGDMQTLDQDLTTALDDCKHQLALHDSVLQQLRDGASDLRQCLADKASKDELDALMQLQLQPSGLDQQAAAPAIQLPAEGDGPVDAAVVAEAVNNQAARLRSLEALLVLLQERLAAASGSAERGVAGLRDGQDGLASRLVKLEVAKAAPAVMRRTSSSQQGRSAARDTGALADALAVLQQQVAGLAAAGDAKADQDALERLEAEVQQLQARSSPDQRAFDSVREELAHLQLLLTGKAEAEALQNLALEVAMLQAAPSATLTMNATTSATPAAAETAPGASLRPSAVGDNSLLAAVQKLVAGKADKDELHLLRRLLGEKANALDLQTIQEALEKLQQDMQRNSASLAGLQRRVTGEAVQTSGWRATPEPPATPSHTTSGLRASGRMSSSLDRDVSPMMASNVDNAPAGTIGTAEIIELQQEVASLKRALDVIARATQVMAVGQPGPAGNPSGGGSPHEPLQKQGGAGRSGQQASGRPQGPGPLEDITASLANALNNGDIRLKADASKLNHSENRQQPASEDVAAASGRTAGAPRPKLDLDKSVRALRSEVAALKKKLAGAGDGLTPRQADGDYAMLASKPVLGYRCMACDRPLAKLEDGTGPHLPLNCLPTHTTMDLAKSNGINREDLPPAVLQRKSQALIAEASRPALSGEARGPQNWYKDKHGPAAEVLPRGDVGPHLAGGGWRATAPQQRAQTASGSSRRKGLGREADGLSGWEKSNHKLPGL